MTRDADPSRPAPEQANGHHGAAAEPARSSTTEAFAPVERAFAKLVGRGAGGGALVVRMGGETVVDLCTGSADARGRRPWTPHTLALSFSTTKGVASTVIHRMADHGLIDYDEPVATYWPEFGAGGKGRVTVRDVLTHRAGLQNVRAVAERAEDLLDHVEMEERLAARAVRAPTERSAYHAITYGWLVAGIARRVSGGRGLAELVQTEVAEPLGVEALHIGVRDAAREQVAEPVGGALRHLGAAARLFSPVWSRSRAPRGALNALLVPGFHRLFEGSEPPIWNTEMPAVNGAFSADALAQLYAALANGGRDGDVQLLAPETVRTLGRVQVRGPDAILGLRMRWRLGYHQAFGTGTDAPRAFGHYGYGGSGGWGDPDLGLSLGFVTNRIGSLTTPMGDLTLYRLSTIVRRCALRAAAPTAA